jgi:hypothetical protein
MVLVGTAVAIDDAGFGAFLAADGYGGVYGNIPVAIAGVSAWGDDDRVVCGGCVNGCLNGRVLARHKPVCARCTNHGYEQNKTDCDNYRFHNSSLSKKNYADCRKQLNFHLPIEHYYNTSRRICKKIGVVFNKLVHCKSIQWL